MKKRGRLFILLVILVIIFSRAILAGCPPDCESQEEASTQEQQNDDIVNNIGSGASGAGTAKYPVQIENSPVGSVNAPPGVTYSTSHEGLEVSHVNQATSKSGITLDNADNVFVGRDGSVRSSFANNFNFKDLFGGEQLSDFSFSNNLLTVSSGSNIHFERPYPIDFPDVKDSWFRVDNSGGLLEWKVTYPANIIYFFKNPFSTGKTMKDSTVPDVLRAEQEFRTTGVVGGAYKIVVIKGNVTGIVDDLGIWGGHENDTLWGSNENFSRKELNFEASDGVTFTFGDFETDNGNYWLNATKGKAGFKWSVEGKGNSYFFSVVNGTMAFYGADFIETLQADFMSFYFDTFEGFFNRALFSSPGFYSFEFPDYRRFHYDNLGKGMSPVFVRGDKHFGQNFKIIRNSSLPYYNLFIDKFSKRSYLNEFENLYSDDENSAYISLFNEHKIMLNGIVDYYRYDFKIGDSSRTWTIIQKNPPYFYLEQASKEYYPIIESLDANNRITLNLKNFNTGADVFIENIEPTNSPIFNAYFKDFMIYELPQKDERLTKRFLRWNDDRYPPVILSLYSPGHPVINLNNDNLFGFREGDSVFTIYPEDLPPLRWSRYKHPLLTLTEEYKKKYGLCFDEFVPFYFNDRPGLSKTIPGWVESNESLKRWLG